MICSWSSAGSGPQAQVLERKLQLAQGVLSRPPCCVVPGPHVARGPGTGAELATGCWGREFRFPKGFPASHRHACS